ncbi:hypothetical protein PtB15_6B594 [Puccinia triticina]|nr:hypothetical protein PtB15_6B594 [Puccinia triticina]
MQELVDTEMQRVVKESNSNAHNTINSNLAYQFQGKLFADAHNQKIPQWAVPNVTSTWNATRNRAGLGPLNFNTGEPGSETATRGDGLRVSTQGLDEAKNRPAASIAGAP